MDVVGAWTGQNASALKRAFRETNEGFAGRLGTSARTVAAWSADPALVPTAEIQRALDTLLFQAASDVKARFALLIGGSKQVENGHAAPRQLTPAQQRLAKDPHMGLPHDRVTSELACPMGLVGRMSLCPSLIPKS
ncbi:hypothetical protein ACWDEN_35890, partial [Streptomyces sp. NPDC001153]